MAKEEIIAAVLEIIKPYNPITWRRRRRAAKAIRKGRVIADDCAYYAVDGKGEKIAGPWCTTCYDRKGERVRFIRAPGPPEQAGHWWRSVQCPVCRHIFTSKGIGEYLNTH